MASSLLADPRLGDPKIHAALAVMRTRAKGQARKDPAHRHPLDELNASLATLDVSLQPKQQSFSDSIADIAIMGGAAYGGKTFALLLEPLKHVSVGGFGAVCFRRTYNRITTEGGMWDESQQLYRRLGAEPKKGDLSWTFPSGSAVSFAHLQLEDDKYAWLGSQIPLLLWDQLEEMSESQFFFLLGRNRSTCGVRPYVRATCNPDPDSWLARFLAWWIDQDTGDPIAERSGILRYMVRLPDDTLAWADDAETLQQTYGETICKSLKSVTFIPATLDDNPLGTTADPTYEANLMIQPAYLRQRLRYGNWKARPLAGQFFKRHWFLVVDAAPASCRWVRCWDRAATEPNPMNPDPDWTAGVKLGKDADGYYYIADVRRDRLSPQGVEAMITTTASQDGKACVVALLKDPAQAGKMEAAYLTRRLAGSDVVLVPQTKDKETAARPVASQAEAGNVRVIRGDWNDAFFTELENFPGGHDDQVDGLSGGFEVVDMRRHHFGPIGT